LGEYNLQLKRAEGGVGDVLVAGQQRGCAAKGRDEEVCVEARVEASEVGQVSDVFAVGVFYEATSPYSSQTLIEECKKCT